MFRLKKIIIFIFLFSFVNTVFSQIQRISHYRVSDGLSQSVANCFFQDSEGYMWVGTQNGLNKFNGYEFEKFIHHPKDSKSISDNWIYAITEDNEGFLWLGTKRGLNKYDKSSDSFTQIKELAGKDITDYSIYGLNIDNKGNILISAPPELFILDTKSGSEKCYISEIPVDPSGRDDNLSVIQDSDGLIWLASTGGPACFDPKQESFIDIEKLKLNKLSNLDIFSIYEDKRGCIFFGTDTGLYKYEKATKKIEVFFTNSGAYSGLNNGKIKAIIADKKGNYWIGTEEQGVDLIKFNESGKIEPLDKIVSRQGYVDALSSNVIYSLFIDRSDNMWIGTQSGVNVIDLKRKKFKLYGKMKGKHTYPFSDNAIFPIYVPEKDIIWLGTWGSGLNIFNRKTGEVTVYSESQTGKNHLTDNFIQVIFDDGDGRIWIGTRNKINIYNIKDKSFKELKEAFPNSNFPDFSNTRVNSIVKSSTGLIYIGTANGLYILNLETLESKTVFVTNKHEYSLSANLIYDILEDDDHQIWIATTNGLDCYNPETGKILHYHKNAKKTNCLTDDFIICLYQDSEGYIWIGTNSGLNRLNKETMHFEYFFYEQNFPSNVVYEIIEDNNNDMWFTTGNGLSKYSRSAREFINYTDKDGLQGLEFNLNACYKSNDGEIFVGGINGLNSFYPDSLGSNNFIPDIVITSLFKQGTGYKEKLNFINEDEIVLTHRDKILTIEFASLDYTNPKENRYAYVMKGFSDKRIDLGKKRTLQLLHLPQGTYELTIFGSNNEGVWNNEGESLKIRVLPPWWKSTFAYISYIIIAILLITFYIKFRERQHVNEKKILEERVKIRTSEINLQKNKIEQANTELKKINEELNSTLETVNLQKEEITQQRDNIEAQKEEIENIVKELEIANKTKDKFFSIIAHDLKAPFNSILGFSELLLKNHNEYDNDKRTEIISFINNSSQSAYKLLENLFTWARSQSGKIEYSPERLNLKNITDEVFSEIKGVSNKKAIKLVNNINQNVFVLADLNMLETVLRNLVSNAIKFTPREGTVSVFSDSSDRAGFLQITVTDTGIGMNEDQINNLFRIDKSISSKGTENEEGTGLGLILCKEFVEKHGGKILVNSEIDKGSSFIFTFPVA